MGKIHLVDLIEKLRLEWLAKMMGLLSNMSVENVPFSFKLCIL